MTGRWSKESGYIFKVGRARIFFLSGDPLLQRRNRGKPPSAARLEAFREDVLGVTRFLLRGKRS